MHDGAEEAKRSVRILDVLEKHGIKTVKAGKQFKACCPFHEDHTPSLSVDPAKNVWHCFGCQKGGSVIDFVMLKEGIDFKTAVDRMLVKSGAVVRAASLDTAKTLPPEDRLSAACPAEAERRRNERRQVIDAIEYYHRTLGGEDTQGLDYLRRRHIADPETLKAFKVGYCNGTLRKVLPESAIPALKKIGLLKADGSEAFAGCIVIPAFTETGDLGEMYGRFIVDRKPTNHLYLPGAHRGVLNAKAGEAYDDIILTEAAFDALTFYAHGVRNVIPCYGTGGFTEDHRTALKNTKRVFFAFDNDQAGEDGAKRLAQTLDAAGLECHRIHVPPGLGRAQGDRLLV